MIEREIKHAKEGRKARIVAKVNSLVTLKLLNFYIKQAAAVLRLI